MNLRRSTDMALEAPIETCKRQLMNLSTVDSCNIYMLVGNGEMRPIQYSRHNPLISEKYAPRHTLVEGNPKQVIQSYFEAGSGRFKTGIWSGEIGAYRLEFGPTKHEFFLLLEGQVRVTPDGGDAFDCLPGDACVLPAGFHGIFEIIVPARKHYAIGE